VHPSQSLFTRIIAVCSENNMKHVTLRAKRRVVRCQSRWYISIETVNDATDRLRQYRTSCVTLVQIKYSTCLYKWHDQYNWRQKTITLHPILNVSVIKQYLIFCNPLHTSANGHGSHIFTPKNGLLCNKLYSQNHSPLSHTVYTPNSNSERSSGAERNDTSHSNCLYQTLSVEMSTAVLSRRHDTAGRSYHKISQHTAAWLHVVKHHQKSASVAAIMRNE
jgi:hypothetical protein